MHLLGTLKALESSFLVLIVVQARSTQDSSVLGISSADHSGSLYLIEVANHREHFADWSWFWVNLITKLNKGFLELLNVILDELVTVEGHCALLLDSIILTISVESDELGVVSFLCLLHAAKSGADLTVIGEEVIVSDSTALDKREVIDKSQYGEGSSNFHFVSLLIL
jgi:hypothetical protein